MIQVDIKHPLLDWQDKAGNLLRLVVEKKNVGVAVQLLLHCGYVRDAATQLHELKSTDGTVTKTADPQDILDLETANNLGTWVQLRMDEKAEQWWNEPANHRKTYFLEETVPSHPEDMKALIFMPPPAMLGVTQGDPAPKQALATGLCHGYAEKLKLDIEKAGGTAIIERVARHMEGCYSDVGFRVRQCKNACSGLVMWRDVLPEAPDGIYVVGGTTNPVKFRTFEKADQKEKLITLPYLWGQMELTKQEDFKDHFELLSERAKQTQTCLVCKTKSPKDQMDRHHPRGKHDRNVYFYAYAHRVCHTTIHNNVDWATDRGFLIENR